MEFVEDIVENFSGRSGRREEEVVYQQSDYYEGGRPPPPSVPAPWIARWGESERQWYFVNEATGETRWEAPGYGGGYGPPQAGYREEVVEERTYYDDRPPQKDHSLAYGLAGGAVGLAGGALLMDEGEKIHDRFEEDKYNVEEDVENFPDNTARWVGDKVGDVENDFDRAKYDVEDFPENAAAFVGDKVGEVERFGDGVEDSYYQGREEGRDGW